MSKFYAYFHAGSENHGCEAIVRSTQSLLEDKMILISSNPAQDKKYEVDRLVQLEGKKTSSYSLLEKIMIKLKKSEKFDYDLAAKHECERYDKGIALSIGGDNYCYGNAYNYYLAGMNKHLHNRGLKTVLWGCSIEPSSVTEKMKKDFSLYDLIAARESISYQFLNEINSNTILICDPAFLLDKEEVELPDGFVEGKTVGINISPLIQKNEMIPGITIKNYEAMIKHILENTDYKIALIPHVVVEGNDDRVPLKTLYDKFCNSNRVVLIEDCNCKKLKYVISKCALFVGARTHSTIAAYSSCVPTLVIGYSTKATGIARDLFGTEDNYVLPVQSLNQEQDITNAFIWLDQNQNQIKAHLKSILSEYTQRIQNGVQQLKSLK